MESKKSKLTNAHPEVLGIGAPLVDQIIHVTDEYLSQIGNKKGGMQIVDFPTFTKLLKDTRVEVKLIPGGSCANTLRGLSRLDHSCAFIGKIGNDSVGDFFLQDLNTLGIKSLCPSSPHTPSGQVLSFVTPDGERTFQTYLGATLELKASDLKLENFTHVKLVHIEGYSLSYPGLAQQTIRYAKKAQALVSLDLASFEIIDTLRNDFLALMDAGVDICFGNEREIMALTGLAAREGCMKLKTLCPIVIATMGKKGSWIGNKDSLTYCPTTPIEKPIDTTGAGDLFMSGFLHGYLHGMPLDICAHFGSLAGAAIVQVEGAHLTDNQWQQLRQEMQNIRF